MKILLDAMGGDNAPKSTVQGAADAVKEFGDGMTLALLGDEAKIKAAAQELGVDLTPFELIHCTEDVDMHDDPVKAVRHKTDSSLVKGLTMLKNGGCLCFRRFHRRTACGHQFDRAHRQGGQAPGAGYLHAGQKAAVFAAGLRRKRRMPCRDAECLWHQGQRVHE